MFYKERNLKNIGKLADHTKEAALKWHEYLVQNNIEVLIYETIRSVEKQKENVANGASQTMKSYHIVGQALDFVPVVNGQSDWNGYGSADIKMAIAEAKRLGFEWGGDWKTFVDKPHLQFNYKGYGTDTFGAVFTTVELPSQGDNTIKTIQSTLNSRYGTSLAVDGRFGPNTHQALLKGLQKEIRVVADGVWGPKTKAACPVIRIGSKGNIVWIAQATEYCLGYNPNGVDGIFGKGTANATLHLQKAKGVSQDAIIGPNTWGVMF